MKEKMSLKKNSSDIIAQEKLAQHYLSKYTKELQLHFNLSDCSLKKVVLKVSSTIKCQNAMNKFLDMIKLFR